MSVIKRAMYYVRRKKAKTFIMFFILFAISTAMISGIAVKKATNVAKEQMYETIQGGFSLVINLQYNMGNAQGRGNIPASVVEQIANVEGIQDYNARIFADANVEGMNSVELKNASAFFEDTYEKQLKSYVGITGVRNSQKDNKFMSGLLKLKEGRHIELGDKGKVLVHETFAKQNQLKLGDTIKVKQYADSPSLKKKTEETMELEIVGIFTGTNPSQPTSRAEMVENAFLTDIETVSQFYGYEKGEEIYNDVNYFVKDPKNLDTVMSDVKKLPISWRDYAIYSNKENYPGIINSMESLDHLIQMVLVGSAVVSIGILALILTFWIQGRIHETGILLSIGISKLNIIAQYILELIIIAFFAFGLSLFSGKAIAQNIGDQLVAQAREDGTRSLYQSGGFQMGADPETSTLGTTIEELDVTVSMSEMVFVWVSGVGIIVCAVAIASSSIIRLKPREILSKMS